MEKFKRKLCAILCAAVLVGLLVPTASAATFTDISGHWAASYIETCAGLGIVDGIGSGKFDPEGKVTNAQFVKMLCAAFYSAEAQTFEAENRAAINTYWGGSIQWYSETSYYFEKMGLLTKVDYNIQSTASADQPMNRNNMAQVAANVLTQKGITANEGDRALAQAKLMLVNDYYNIPESNRDAVKTCYALGIITGTDGGKFDGGNTMTRAQACAVITRLLGAVGTTTPNEPAPMPTLEPIKPTTIEVKSTVTSSNDTYYQVVDNGYPTGMLNNGKPVTEENVLALLDEAQKIWPDGMTWGPHTVIGNNSYLNPGAVVNSTIRNKHGSSTNYACGGFTAMISDYLFGKTQNPARAVTDYTKLRPGDIIVWLDKNGTTEHVAFVASSIIKEGDYPDKPFYVGRFWIADGNVNGLVSWPNYEYSSPTSMEMIIQYNPDQRWAFYTRYPD